MRARAALAALLVMAGVAHAEPPTTSPRPLPNPHRPAEAAPDPAAVPHPVPSPLAGASLAASAISAARPAPLAPAPQLAAEPNGTLTILAASPRPMPRPESGAPAATAPAPQVTMSGASVPLKLGKPGAKGMVCGTPGLVGVAVPAIPGELEGCGLENGVRLTSVAGVPLSIPATVDCNTAKALKTWVDRGIIPAVGRAGGGLARLEIAGSYACRGRNRQAGAKISEHGRGKAIDLRGLTLANGKVITVEADWRREGKILQAVHRSACGTFGTVLGPKSDAFHRDHIHVDTARYSYGAYCK